MGLSIKMIQMSDDHPNFFEDCKTKEEVQHLYTDHCGSMLAGLIRLVDRITDKETPVTAHDAEEILTNFGMHMVVSVQAKERLEKYEVDKDKESGWTSVEKDNKIDVSLLKHKPGEN